MAQRSRRLRKKLRVDEFQELGFEVQWHFPADTAVEAVDALTDRFIAELIEPRGLAFAGSGYLAWEGLVCTQAIGRCSEEDVITSYSIHYTKLYELAARIIFQRSLRRKNAFVAVNCGAIPANLIQSELFGHEKGSFTGACRRQIGHIEAANGGTLFLDEIGDLPLELQVNLLRFLQEKIITRVGGTEPIPVDVRVITATHRDLREEIRAGRFREDLFYRLCVLDLELPPLRERREDIELLAYHFLRKLAPGLNPLVRGFSALALQQMHAYQWPGNVRELRNRVERALVMCEKRVICPLDLQLEPAPQTEEQPTLAEVRAQAEQQAMQSALNATGNNIVAAARQLGVSRVTLYRMLDKYKQLVS